MTLLPSDGEANFLYKFRPPNEHTLENLAQHRLRFSFPREFNDPFDCAARIEYSGTKEDWDRWLDCSEDLSSEDRQKVEQHLASIHYDGKEMGHEIH